MSDKFKKVKDSGKRQDFSTGSVRDTNEGKPRKYTNEIGEEFYLASDMDTYLEAIADVEGLGTMIHTTRAWQALHLEVQAEILVDVKKHLAVAISKRIKGKVA